METAFLPHPLYDLDEAVLQEVHSLRPALGWRDEEEELWWEEEEEEELWEEEEEEEWEEEEW
jgi:hypothetical protein